MKRINKYKDKIDNLSVEIFTIEKDNYGECNVFLLFIDNKLEYSIVIDSCEDNLHTLVDQILEKYTINTFDMICWTHPHIDHSKGMLNLLKKYANNQTKLVIPADLSITEKCMNKDCQDIYNYIFKDISKGMTKTFGEYISASKNVILEKIKYVELNTERKVKLDIDVLAPIPNRLSSLKGNCKYETNKKCYHDFNEYSVVLLIRVNGVAFLFSADATPGTINEMLYDENELQYVVFSKIPHHGSRDSSNLINKYDESTCEGMLCVTTSLINGTTILPDKDTLKKYKKLGGKIYCTSKVPFKKTTKSEQYGLLKLRFDMIPENKQPKVTYELHGDAFEYKK